MLKNPVFAAVFTTFYLVAYYVLFHYEASLKLLGTMFLLSPALLIRMIYTVLKYGRYDGPELGKDEEFGYQDRKKETLGVF